MTLLSRKTVMAAKVETTPGTPESLTNSEGAFNIYNARIVPTIPIEERTGQSAFNKLAGVPGARSATLTFETDMAWDGTATIPTWASVFLPACGFVNSSGTITPRTEAPGSNVKTLTMATYIDGKKQLMYGAMGNFVMTLPSGRMGRIAWTFTGIWGGETDTALIAPTYPTATPLRFASATGLTFASVALTVEQVTIDSGNTVVLREDATTATGYATALITNRTPMITANPEAVLVATEDRYGDWLAGTTGTWTCTLDGPSDSTIQIQSTVAQYETVAPGSRNDYEIDDITWKCLKNGTSNDQELSIQFTEAS